MSREDQNRLDSLEKQMRLMTAGLAAVAERQDFLEAAMSMDAANNAVVEGDEIEQAPRATRNGKAKAR